VGLRIGSGPLVIARLPGLLGLPPALSQLAGVVENLVGHLEALVGIKTQDLLGRRDFVVAQRGSMRLTGALQLRSGPTDDRAEANETRLVGHCPRGIQRFDEGSDVLGVRAVAIGPVDVLDMPSVRGIAS